MTQITFPVAFYLGKYPTTSALPPTTGPTNIFASVQCMGPDSEVLELIYLRPDATQWCDDLGRVCQWQSNSYDVAAKHGIAYFNAHEFAWHYALLTSGRAVRAQVDDAYPGGNRIFADVAMSEPSQEAVPDVIAWLNQHVNIYDALKWNEPSAMGLHYADWSPQQQQDFRQAFAAAWNHQPMTFDDPPPNLADTTNRAVWTVLDIAHAWQIFCAYAAHSLAVEIGGRVPWSIVSYKAENLALLLDGSRLFTYDPALSGYTLMISAVPAPPEFTWSFLSSNDLIGADRLSTIARMLDWCRNNLLHYSSVSTPAGDMLAHWGYAGSPPASRVIQGTVNSMEPRLGVRHYTAGCWGTTAFLQAVLRTVNIPVDSVYCGGHRTPHFTTDDRYLSHGDDPYYLSSKCTPPYDAGCLLIDGATFNSWFGASVPSTTKENNVGRQVAILAVQNLPDILLHLYYREQLAGLSPQNGYVYPQLQRYYPDINELCPDLWQRLEQKLSGFGYPDKVFFQWPSKLPRIYCDPIFRILPPRLISALGRWFHFSDNITHG